MVPAFQQQGAQQSVLLASYHRLLMLCVLSRRSYVMVLGAVLPALGKSISSSVEEAQPVHAVSMYAQSVDKLCVQHVLPQEGVTAICNFRISHYTRQPLLYMTTHHCSLSSCVAKTDGECNP